MRTPGHPFLRAVEYDVAGETYRAQINLAGNLQVMLWSPKAEAFEHVHNVDHIEAARIAFRLFSARDQALDPTPGVQL